MELKVLHRKKKILKTLIIKNSKIFRMLKYILQGLIIITIVVCVVYPTVNIMSPTLSIVNVQGVPTKDIPSIIVNTVIFLIIGSFLSIILRTILMDLSGKDITGRKKEQLLIEKNKLIYTYGIKWFSLSNERVVITIPLDGDACWRYCTETEQLRFTGRIKSIYYKNFNTNRQRAMHTTTLDEFIIYDCFMPSLYSVLCENKPMDLQEGTI